LIGSLEPNPGIRDKLPELLEMLRRARHVHVGTHLNPDGDALGSALAFSMALEQLGVSHEVLCNNPAPGYLQFLKGTEKVKQTYDREADLAIALDLEDLDRLGRIKEPFQTAPVLIIIDHHIPHHRVGDLRIIDQESPATCAILCDLFFDTDIKITPAMADCLLTGLLTDTGSFRFPNTTPHCLHLGARLLEYGARLAAISEEVYLTKAEAAVRLLGEAIHKIKMSRDKKIAWAILPAKLYEDLQAKDEHTEGIVNEILSISTVQVAALVKETRPGRYKASLRSRGDVDVAAVAQTFGGGGHKNAAGLTLEGTEPEVERTIVQALTKCLASS
jgi:phosphoesterase RecJ-like protein